MLEFAVLGILHDSAMHGYELRKRLRELLGSLRAFSFGSLYPTLRRLQRRGLIAERDPEEGARSQQRRARKVYELTAEGKERFAELAEDAGPNSCDDEGFGVHMVFFTRTSASARMRILEGRRRRVEQRREGLRSALARAGEQIDRYTRELHQQGLEASEREVRWLNELIAHERAEQETEESEESGHGR
ncbi:PadR family transcriptional regulator [Sciscionella sediminilitoris]|uniref:PadR family transcriptional regulator n=1 Tax=Sciscionella sediminilitoris TaxID=1445613 RepID=UPI0004DFB16C|nr:PadR family transcriptional regulator [Sciscionella sp. SE31]